MTSMLERACMIRLNLANIRREQGRTLFQENRFVDAAECLLTALQFFSSSRVFDNLKVKAEEISLSCFLNLASCYVLLRNWKDAVLYATKALEINPNSCKALYRRGQAYNELEEYSAAQEDLKLSLVLSCGDVSVQEELVKAITLQRMEILRQKKLFSKMFAEN
eukprot:PhF_6_TR1222/c0_g1_i1/m.2348/K05864/PPID, CYPD; peptidyl-prolyl isomerase D